MSGVRPRGNVADLVELVRLPAALTVPGDSLAGASTAGWPLGRRTWLLPAASACLYWAGMALNDYADRELDAVERPERPIPSGRVTATRALQLASGLTAAGVGLAAVAGGRRALAVAVPLAGAVWTYDLVAKNSPLGPVVMAGARALDVLLGAAGDVRAGAAPALTVAAHTVGVTTLSRGEVHGSRSAVAAAAAANTVAIAARVGIPERGRPGLVTSTAALLAATYAATVGRAQAQAAQSPDATTVRAATGSGVRGAIPLQAALTARAGSVGAAVAVVAAGPVARAASRVVSTT
ncbi:MAG: SCO3242 family prenyltransferase [Nocardioidaceae bacterium]